MIYYNISVSIEGIYELTVAAESEDEATDIALDEVDKLDFGDLQNVDISVIDVSEE